jgi:hypothetical protein
MNLGAQWLPEHVVLAINLHERHLSGQLAADEFVRLTGKTITRCAMIGKWNRLGLRPGNEPVIRKVRAPEKKRVVPMVPSPPLSSPSRSLPASAETEPELSPQPCDIIALRFYDQCRWVMSDPRVFPVYYCGGAREFPGDDAPHMYCKYHGRLSRSGGTKRE